jgi:hypothetical protein
VKGVKSGEYTLKVLGTGMDYFKVDFAKQKNDWVRKFTA